MLVKIQPEALTECSEVWLSHLAWNQGIAGSNPATQTNSTDVLQDYVNLKSTLGRRPTAIG